MQPARRWPLTAMVDVLIVVAGIALALYFILDDTPEPWMIRLSWAGALTAGIAVFCYAVARLTDRHDPYV